jgi:hypothetical protein
MCGIELERFQVSSSTVVHAQGGSVFGAVSGYSTVGGAHRRQLVRALPFRNKLDGGKPSFIWGQ